MTIDEALKYFKDEIFSYEMAPDLNGCEMRDDWQRIMDACQLAVKALEGMRILENPVTIADSVRAMSDKELAKLICDGASDLCSFCGNTACEIRESWEMCDSNDTDEEIVLKWLRSRVG